MNRLSHIYIGGYVLRQYFPDATAAQKKAFMLGCVYPDRNPFTHLKGSLRHQPFRGHNWDNAQGLIRRLCARLEGKRRLDTRSAYTLGLLLHYCCDAFTFAHNRAFCQSLKQHRAYEARLHRLLTGQGFAESVPVRPASALWPRIASLHSQYRHQPCTAANDCQYIFQAVSLVSVSFGAQIGAYPGASYILPKKIPEFCPICTCKTEKTVVY